jgi:beta-glucanase (GH16 family)
MLPSDSKYGTWAACGEIDILESRGNQVDETVGTIHFGGTWPRNTHLGTTWKFPEKNAAEAFHVYAIEWQRDEIRWYVDDHCYQTITKDKWHSEAAPDSETAPFDQRFHLILNLAVDGGFFEGTDQKSSRLADEAFPQVFEIDYVRVYQWAAPQEER